MFEHYDTIFLFKLSHPEIIIITLSSNSTCCIGTVVCRYRNFFNRSVTLSTCMRTLESCLEVSASHRDNCDFPFVKQRILRTAPADAILSWRLNPISKNKITKSQLFKKSRLQGYLLAWYTSTPSRWKKTDQTSWSNPNQMLDCVVML